MSAVTDISLAMPPSVNSIWRVNRFRNKPYLSERYKTWKRDADNRYLMNKKTWRPIAGHFRAHITLDETRRGNSDADNRVKCLMDFLQRVQIIENDKLCDGLTVTWGRAPEGCRIRLRAA